MGESWQVVGEDWTSDPVPGSWWDALAACLQHELAGEQYIGLRVEIGGLGELALHRLEGGAVLRMRRVDDAWSRHRWSRLGMTDRPVILNEDMPYLHFGAAPRHLALGVEPEVVAETCTEGDTAPVVFEWGTGAIAPVSQVVGASVDAVEAGVESACRELDRAETVVEATELALSALRRFIEAERGAVMLSGQDPTLLDIVCLRGVAADQQSRLVAPRARGLGAFVSSSGTAMMVNAPGAPAVFRPLEIASGEGSRAVLCVPVLDLRSGVVKGVIELSRPTVRFQHWQLEVGIAIAAALADALTRIQSQRRGRVAWAG